MLDEPPLIASTQFLFDFIISTIGYFTFKNLELNATTIVLKLIKAAPCGSLKPI
jgi:hypothetical protein